VVLVTPRNMGIIATSHLARDMCRSFPNIRWALVVGIAGGAPFRYREGQQERSDIRLGDVIVSTQVVGYDFGAEYDDGFRSKTAVEDVLPRAPASVANFINMLRTRNSAAFRRVLASTNEDFADYTYLHTDGEGSYQRPPPETDRVYASDYRHKHQGSAACETCSRCTDWRHGVCDEVLKASCERLGCVPSHIVREERDTKIHFGRIASGNAIMKSARKRDLLIEREECIGFEMESAGTWEVFGTIVVKGVVDYADSHKNKVWRLYSAARAALCAKALIEEIEMSDM